MLVNRLNQLSNSNRALKQWVRHPRPHWYSDQNELFPQATVKPSKIKYSGVNHVVLEKVLSTPGAIIGHGDRKSLDSRPPIIWDIFLFLEQVAPSCVEHSRTC